MELKGEGGFTGAKRSELEYTSLVRMWGGRLWMDLPVIFSSELVDSAAQSAKSGNGCSRKCGNG